MKVYEQLIKILILISSTEITKVENNFVKYFVVHTEKLPKS